MGRSARGWLLTDNELGFSCAAVCFQSVDKTDGITEILQVLPMEKTFKLLPDLLFDHGRCASLFDAPEKQAVLVQPDELIFSDAVDVQIVDAEGVKKIALSPAVHEPHQLFVSSKDAVDMSIGKRATWRSAESLDDIIELIADKRKDVVV